MKDENEIQAPIACRACSANQPVQVYAVREAIRCACPVCGAGGPLAETREGAIRRWNEMWQAPLPPSVRKLVDEISFAGFDFDEPIRMSQAFGVGLRFRGSDILEVLRDCGIEVQP